MIGAATRGGILPRLKLEVDLPIAEMTPSPRIGAGD